PSTSPSMQPSVTPSGKPSVQPSSIPTRQPSSQPNRSPSMQPCSRLTTLPTAPTCSPTLISLGSLPSDASLSVVYNTNTHNVVEFKIVLPFMFVLPEIGDQFFDVVVSEPIYGVNYVLFGGNRAKENPVESSHISTSELTQVG